MTSPPLWSLPFLATWMFVFSQLPLCSGMDKPKLEFKHRVFVAFEGDNLTVEYTLQIPSNQTRDGLSCFDPSGNKIYRDQIPATIEPQTLPGKAQLKGLVSSGEYSCRYKTAKAYLFLRLRAQGFSNTSVVDMPWFIAILIFTGVLLIFSVLSTVYLFRGHWNGETAKCDDPNKELMQDKEKEKRSTNVDANTSTSFYASLEPRPRSIYDVLDRSAANAVADEGETTPVPKTSQKSNAPQTEDEGVFDSVYENL